MHPYLYSKSCILLTYAALNRMQMQMIQDDERGTFYNLVQAFSLGTTASAWFRYITHNPITEKHIIPMIVIPLFVSLGISGSRYVAQKLNYFALGMEALEQKFGKWTDIIARIASITLVILLIPQAEKEPLFFGLAFATTGLELWGYCRQIHSFNQSSPQSGSGS